MKNKMFSSILPYMMLATTINDAFAEPSNGRSISYRTNNKMPLNEEESEKLHQLKGKAKKEYIKELELKYYV